ncbi:LuxR family transcriptional regulator [Paractinoplanes ferrugineus]|uniref:Helix-turn-helix transcriptional regulator n=1 Tax=Paractinoplanes ferrugineus TaxID=113564 RepID=A0A919MN16_9ACTN|nr:helix-turn-helix transcriptional regulator [Actinoplanes ferrugineus]
MELALIGDRVRDARRGLGSTVLVEAAAGFGKTRLLAEAARVAGDEQFAMASAIADPGDQNMTFVPMAQLIAALAGALGGSGQSVVAESAPAWDVTEIEARLERAALVKPMMICLDDVQWADPGTIAALGVLPRRLRSLPIVWMIAYRPGQAPPSLRDVVDRLVRGGADRLVLDRLGEDDVALVISDIVHGQADTELLHLADRTEGSPYLLVELLRGLLEEGLVHRNDGLVELTGDELPVRVRETMRERLNRLPSGSRQAARVASVLGRWFSFSLLAAMLDVSPGAVLAPVDELVRTDLLTETADGRLGFRHDLIREAVRDTLPASARRALQRQAADLMLARGAPPLQVASLLVAGADTGDRFAAETLLSAARSLRSLDAAAAADLGRKALDMIGPEDPLRGPLVAQVALSLHIAGRAEEGKAFADTALRTVLPPAQEAEIRLQIAKMLWIPAEDRVDAARRALALDGVPLDVRANLLANLVSSSQGAGRFAEAKALGPEAEQAAAASGDPTVAAFTDMCLAMIPYAEGRFVDALERQDRAGKRGTLTDIDRPERDAVRTRFLGPVEHPAAIVRICEAGLVAAHRVGSQWTAMVWEQQRAVALLVLGRLSDAAATLEGLYEPDERPRVLNTVDASGVVALGQAALHLGEARTLAVCVDLATATVASTGGELRVQAGWLLLRAALARGNVAGARELLDRLGGVSRGVPRWPMWQDDLVWIARLAQSSDDSALAEAARIGAATRASLNPGVDAIAAFTTYTAALLDRDTEGLAEAMTGLERTGRLLAHAFATEDQGRLLLDQGKRETGIEVLSTALERYAVLGAAWDAGRVRRRLRDVGVRRRLGATTAPREGWAALTETELNVVRLVAEGQTNREVAEQLFVSPHTVSTHLRHSFAKLGVNSRVDLARLFAEHGNER